MFAAVPEKLAALSPEIFKREQEKRSKELIDAAREMQAALRVALAELVGDMIERLTQPDDNGKKKVIRPGKLVDNVRDFVASFNVRNLTNDTELAALTEKAKAILEGVDADTLCKDLDIRKSVRQGFEAIKSNLDGMLTEKPARMLSLDDDE